MQTIKRNTFWITGLLLITNILMAQEIPSRINDGVNLPQQKEVKRNALTDLNLSSEQLKQLQALNKDAKQQQKNITSDSNISAKQKRERLQALKKQQADKRKTIFTAEQYTKYEQNLKESKEQRKNGSSKKSVLNTIEKNKGKDENGLSRKDTPKTSKNKKANWNDLKLTAEQRDEVKQTTEQYKSQLQLVRNNISLNASEKQNQIKQVQREYNMQLGTILTAGQKAKWDEKQRKSRLMMSQGELRNNKQGLKGSMK